MSAFHKYLLSQPKSEAIRHVYECLRNGGSGNMAWDLIEQYNGTDWRCKPNEMEKFISDTLDMLYTDYVKAEVDGVKPVTQEEFDKLVESVEELHSNVVMCSGCGRESYRVFCTVCGFVKEEIEPEFKPIVDPKDDGE